MSMMSMKVRVRVRVWGIWIYKVMRDKLQEWEWKGVKK